MRSIKSLVWRNLTAHPLRSTLTALAIMLGVGMVLATAVIGQAANQQITTLEAGAAAQSDSTLSTLMLQVGLVMVGLIILFAAAFVIMNAFAMSITARTREIGSLRTLGMTRRQILNQVMAEAGLLGLIGAAVGIPIGVGLAWLVMVLRDTVPDGGLIVPWWGIMLSLVLGLTTTMAGALQPAYRASKLSPLMAMQSRAQTTENPSRTPKIGIIMFFGLLIGLPVIAFIWQPDFVQSGALLGVGILGMLTAVLTFMPLLIPPMTGWTRPFLTHYFGTAGRLAADNITRNTRRTARTAAALTIGLTMIIATSTLLTASLKGGLEGFLSLSNENAMVIHDISALLASGEMTLENSMEIDKSMKPIDPAVLAAIVESGIAEQVIRYGFAAIPSEIATFPGTPGGFIEPQKFFSLGNFDFFEGDPDSALAMMQKGDALLLIPMTAARLGVSVGDTISVATPHGDVGFVVAGIGGTTSNFTLFSYADGERYFDLTDPAWLGIVAKEGEADEVIAELEKVITPFDNLVVFDLRDSGAGGLTEIVDQLRSLLNGMLLLAVIVAALGIVNTMVINVSERGREIGLLRAVGATRRQVRQSVMLEAAAVGLMAALIAAGLALLLLGMYSLIFLPNGGASVGLRMNRDVFANMMLPALKDWGKTAVFSLILGPLIAALAAYYPARQAAAVNVVEATRSEQLSLSSGGNGRKESRHQPSKHLYSLAWRNLQEYRWRAMFSAFAVALGVAMIVAAEVTSSGIVGGLSGDGDELLAWFLDMLDIVLSIIGIIILAAAGFLIFNAFGMTVTQRRKQIGLLRALGMTRKQVMRQIQTEALIIGAAGTALGLLLGSPFGNFTLTAFRKLGVEMGRGSPSVGSLVWGVVMGIGITLLSVWIPARRAAKVSPLTALQASDNSQLSSRHSPLVTRRSLIGVLIFIILWGYLAIAPPGAWSGNHPPMELIMIPVLLLPWMVAVGLLLPALIGGTGGLMKRVSVKIGNVNGGRTINARLIADNLTRDRRRVTLTVLTFAVGLTMISGMRGILTFSNDVLLVQSAAGSLAQTTWYVYPFDRNNGIDQLDEISNGVGLSPAVMADFLELADGRAIVTEEYIVTIPEISAIMPGFFSSISELGELTRPGMFTFVEGDWETAVPIMEAGCGLLLPPVVANRHEVGVGDALILPGKEGDVACIVAGIGSGGNLPISRISMAAKEQFAVGNPTVLMMWPLPETDEAAFRDELDALADKHGDAAWVNDTQEELDAVLDTSDQLEKMTYAMLALAVVAAALGMVNTTVMSVTERRHEFGLLRAVGMTRRQVVTIVTGEAAMVGVLGGLVGLIAGTGMTLIFGLSFGGIPFGIVDLPLWSSAWEAGQQAIAAGLVGMILAPMIAAFAAYWPSRSVLRGSAIETMEGRSHPPRSSAGLFSRGSIRTRFMAGTAVLMLLVLVGLTAVVTLHARDYLEEVMADSVTAMVEFTANLIEFNLPPDADALTLDTLQNGSMNAETMLQFRSLIDEMNAYGFAEFIIADQDDVVLFGFDLGQMGTVLPALQDGEKTITAVTETDDGQRQIEASAPIRNADGDLLGSSRLRMELGEINDFLRDLSGAILMVGALILALGLVLAWWATTPLVRTTRQLAAGAEQAGQGQFGKIALQRRWNVSLKVKLTAVMVIILILLVGLLEQVVLPIERQKVEEVTQTTLIVATEWMAQLFSSGLADQSVNLSEISDLSDMLQLAQATDISKMQDLSDQMQTADIAYMALINENGIVQLADQIDMIGSDIPIPTQTQLEETVWQDDPIWRITTPLYNEGNRTIIGGLQMGMYSAQVDDFLDESRALFRLTGIIAILAGVILAQVIGGAITAPVQRLAADSRRVGDGDLSVQFKVNSHDELSQLAGAFNEMVTGLQEREWLRDMFGRFVSREVAEAIRTGQVKLEGENRVVSVLFCDIRGFTSRSEKSTPAEIVALLNEYLPVVVDAARKHEGMVNKFGGDSTLIVYGAPKELQESAYRAVCTALEMQQNLAALNQTLAARGEEPIRIGVGISTGMVLAGAVGTPERQEYTVIGDTVNLASRIEALNKVYPQHGVLISGKTYEALGSRKSEFVFTDLGMVEIRGKSEAVRVWGVGA